MSSIIERWKRIVPHIPYAVRHDFWRKLFALVFAILLTGVAYRNVKSDMELIKLDVRDVPVRFVPVEPGVALIPRDVSVDIAVEVPQERKNLKNTDFYLECPVARTQVENDTPVKLVADMVKTSVPVDGLRVLSFYPEMIPLNIDIMDTKNVPVHPVSDSAELMDGYHASLVRPEKPVTIRGPKKLLDTVDYVETEKIPMANVTKSFSRQVDLIPPYDGKVEILSGKVKVEVRVEKDKPRPFEGIPIQTLLGGNATNNLAVTHVEPESVTVLVDSVPDISRTQIHPFLNLSDISRPGVYTLDVKCWMESDRIKVIEVIPAKATVTLEFVSPSSK